MKSKGIKDYVHLYLAFLLFSITSIMNKLASGYSLFSLSFLLFYGLGLLILMIYAVLWQRVLVRFDLSVAYANRPVVTILEVLWGVLLFRESLTWNMVLGAGIIFIGIRMVVLEYGA